MKKQKTPTSRINSKATTDVVELNAITELILAKYAIEKIICFGSIINDTLNKSCFETAENENKVKLLNSYYLLVVPQTGEITANVVMQMQLEEHVKGLANVTIIVHRMDDINNALEKGSSFFTTIYRKGTMLYDRENEVFATPGPGLELSKRIIKRQEFWHRWFNLSDGFLKGAVFFKNANNYNLSVYMLHQALQHCYSGILRVLTGYHTNANGLRRLMKLIDNILPESSFASSAKTPEDLRLTGLLLKGFGDARYNDKFEVTASELSLMINRIEEILKTANTKCLQRLKA